jgi:6-phosphogluconolactonase (cycloisomerase 2 family)
MHHLSSKRARSVLAGLVSLAGAAVVGAAALPAAAAAEPQQPDYVYVNDNTAGTNTVAGFVRDASGRLTPIPGSPFNAGGAGTGSGLASQGAIQVSSNGRYVIAVDAGSNEISVLRIHDDGSLKLVHDGVVPSGGDKPVSVAEHGRLVYVADAGTAGSNYTGFTLGHGGRLDPLAGSTIALPADAQPGDVLFNSTGTNLVGTRVGSSAIDSFSVGGDGRLTAAAGSPFTAQGAGPFGSEFRPTDPSQLFVSNAHGGAGNGTVSAFSVAGDGTLSSIGASPFADQQTAPCWVEITHDGRFLFTVNTASGSISRYLIGHRGVLHLLGSTSIRAGSTAGAVDARLSPDGRFLYVDESAAGAVAAFAVHGGNLAELATSPVSLPAGAAPAGIATN